MTTTLTPPPTIISEQQSTLEALQEINQRAIETLARLETEQQQHRAQIATLQAEQHAIDAEREERRIALGKERNQAAHLTERHSNDLHFAGLATGTAHEQQTLRAAATSQKELEQAQRLLGKLERAHDQAEQIAHQREQEITAQIAQAQRDLADIEQQLPGVEASRLRAHDELGEQVHCAVLAEYEVGQDHIDALRAQLVNEQLKRNEFLDAALEKLRPWPALRQEMLQERPLEDATSRTITAAVTYLETLLRERGELKGDLPACPSARGMYYWYEVLCVPQSEIYGHENIKGRTVWLEDRLRKLHALEREYQATLQS